MTGQPVAPMLLPTPPPVAASPAGLIPLVMVSMPDSGGPSGPASNAKRTRTGASLPTLEQKARDST